MPGPIPEWQSKGMDTLRSPIRSPWPTRPAPRGRGVPHILVFFLIIFLLAGGLIAFSQWRKPRLIVHVSPLAPSAKTCSEILTRENGGQANVRMCRTKLVHLPWFQAEVTNVGHESTYFSCTIQALDPTGSVLFAGGRPPTPSGAGVDWVESGRTVSWDYYLPKRFDEPVARYSGQCAPNNIRAI